MLQHFNTTVFCFKTCLVSPEGRLNVLADQVHSSPEEATNPHTRSTSGLQMIVMCSTEPGCVCRLVQETF